MFQALLDENYQPNYQRELQLSVGTKVVDVLKVFKDKDSRILDFALLALAEDKNLIPHITVIKNFINRAIGQALLGDYFANPFMLTSERTSTAKQEKEFIRDIIEVHSKKKSALIKKQPELVNWLKNIVGGEYKIENNQIFFAYQNQNGLKNHKIPLYLASATAASQVEIDFYLKCLAKKGDILLIDEPEQNLHLANQRKMARLFVMLIKAGVKVFIATQSDYLIKELNNLIVFSNSFYDKEEIMKKYMYTEKDVLDRSLVKVYAAEKNTLIGADIDEMGIEVTSFDKEIDEMNYIYDDMLFAMAA
jgi:predicted ATP-dependent endonuclease of OLD family